MEMNWWGGGEGDVKVAGFQQRHEWGGACLVVFLHYDLPMKHPSPLPQHVEKKAEETMGYRTAWRWWGSSSSQMTHYTCWEASWSTFQICVRTAEQHKWWTALQRLPGDTRRWRGCICLMLLVMNQTMKIREHTWTPVTITEVFTSPMAQCPTSTNAKVWKNLSVLAILLYRPLCVPLWM